MATAEQTGTDRVIEARRQHVARGVNTPPLAVAHAQGARITDVDGPRARCVRLAFAARRCGAAGARAAAARRSPEALEVCREPLPD